MRRLITIVMLLSASLFALPCYSMWFCQATNLRQTGIWNWHSTTSQRARQGALNACATSFGTGGDLYLETHNPATCHIINCWTEPG